MKLKQPLMISSIALAVAAFAQPAGDQVPRKVRVSWGVMERNLVHKVEPELPTGSAGKPVHGHVVLGITVDKRGNVARAVRLDGEPAPADAAINAVKQWTFKPFLLNGEPIEMESQVDLKLRPVNGNSKQR